MDSSTSTDSEFEQSLLSECASHSTSALESLSSDSFEYILQSDNDSSSLDSFSELDSDSETCSLDLDDTLEGEDLHHSIDEDLEPTFQTEHHKPLYPGSDLTVFDSYLLCFQFALRHNLTNKAFSELLLLLRIQLPKEAAPPKSVYTLKKFFVRMFSSTKADVHLYCVTCQHLLDDLGACPTQNCPNRGMAKFVSIPLGPQIKERLEDPETWKALQERFRRGDINDIYDGLEYESHKVFLSDPANLSFIMNTDGVAIYHSSKISVWPIWIIVNEFPKRMRFNKRHMLLAGLRYSRAKPKMRTLLHPFVTEMNMLYQKGIEVSTPDGVMVSRSALLAVSVDLPARALVLNTKQYNGKWACCYCEDQGTPVPGCPQARYWPPPENMDNPPKLRTHQSILENAVMAASSDPEVTEADIKGVKGPSILSTHSPFDSVKGCAIDTLHCLYLGVALLLLNLWFGKSYRDKEFSIYKQVETCDQRLLGIAVPDVISRTPKSLNEFTHWKGSELQCWLLYFALPVLHGILPSTCYTHFKLLVVALHILSSETISRSQLQLADQLLKRFYQHFPIIYGSRRCTMNVHLLSHLGQCVEALGPLWAYTCFPFESHNGDMKKMFHGTRDMSKQLIFSYIMHQLLPTVPRAQPSGSLQSSINVLFGVKHINKWPIQGTACSIIGGTTLLLPAPAVSGAITAKFGPQPSHRLTVFYRLYKSGEIFFSKTYERVKKRNSYTVRYYRECFGQICISLSLMLRRMLSLLNVYRTTLLKLYYHS